MTRCADISESPRPSRNRWCAPSIWDGQVCLRNLAYLTRLHQSDAFERMRVAAITPSQAEA